MATTSPTATRDLHQWGYLKVSLYTFWSFYALRQTVYMETNKQNILSVTKIVAYQKYVHINPLVPELFFLILAHLYIKCE